MDTNDTGQMPEELQSTRKSPRAFLSRILGRINPSTGRVVARPSTASWSAPAAAPGPVGFVAGLSGADLDTLNAAILRGQSMLNSISSGRDIVAEREVSRDNT